MDFQYNEDQAALLEGLNAILKDHSDIPQSAKSGYYFFHEELQALIERSGFLDVGREIDALSAAILTIEAARVAPLVEVGMSAIIAGALFPERRLPAPIAYVSWERIDKPHRNLSIAKTALIDMGERVALVSVEAAQVEQVQSIYGFPYGRFLKKPDVSEMLIDGGGSELRRLIRVTIAAEFAGAAQAAIEFTLDYVKERQIFGRPIGSFQAVQHRLAHCWQIAKGLRWLALKAAWSGGEYDAAMAIAYAQANAQNIIYDLHQFNGAMAIDIYHLLHFWTYRLRALQGELGGAGAAERWAADVRWGRAGAAEVRD